MRDPILAQRIHQGTGDVVLTGNVGKALRTIFSSQNLIAHLHLLHCRI
jgi:hypothetical protein